MLIDEKRLFFGFAIDAPWPDDFPQGRLLDDKERHITLAFLGNTSYPKLKDALLRFPKPSFKVGFVAKFDQCLFFPKRFPRVVAWHPHLLEKEDELMSYQKAFVNWLQKEGFNPDCKHAFNPHATIARKPFNEKEWKHHFRPLPCILKDIKLYESIGNLTYSTLWSWPLFSPFEPIEHTADLAFLIYGEKFENLFLHAVWALSFTFPEMMGFYKPSSSLSSIDQVIYLLNEIIYEADCKVGCPFKAVSFHTKIEEKEGLLSWEMIVDV